MVKLFTWYFILLILVYSCRDFTNFSGVLGRSWIQLQKISDFCNRSKCRKMRKGITFGQIRIQPRKNECQKNIIFRILSFLFDQDQQLLNLSLSIKVRKIDGFCPLFKTLFTYPTTNILYQLLAEYAIFALLRVLL